MAYLVDERRTQHDGNCVLSLCLAPIPSFIQSLGQPERVLRITKRPGCCLLQRANSQVQRRN